MAAARRMYWWYAAAARAPTSGPTQKIHCRHHKVEYEVNLFELITHFSTCWWTYLIIPGFVLVINDGGAEAPGRVDAGPGDGDGGEMHHEHSEADGERR